MEKFGRVRASAWLEALDGPRKGEKIFITSAGLSVGRKRENDLPLEDPLVSREHARIEQELSGFSIKDLGSKNGVFVNDKLIDSVSLKNGDIIRIGSSIFRFHMEEEKQEEVIFEGKKEFVKKQKKTSPVRVMIYVLTAFTFIIFLIALTSKKEEPKETSRKTSEERNVVEPIIPSTPTPSESSPQTSFKKELTEEEKLKFDSLVQQGEIAFFQGSYADSINLFKEALTINPDCDVCKKRINEANKKLIEVIKDIDKRAHEFFESLQYQRAIEEWQRILDIIKDPNNQLYIEANKNIEKAKERMK